MPLFPPPVLAPGGLLEMEYHDAGVGERHTWHIHVCHFDPTTFHYISGGPKTPTEVGISQTFSALAAIWSPYYPASWTLSLTCVYYNSGGIMTRLSSVPSTAPVAGTSGLTAYLGPTVRRLFRLYSRFGARSRLWIQQIPGDTVDYTVQVSPTAGGLDSKDRDVMAYLSGAAAGAVSTDGQVFQAQAALSLEWSRPLEAVSPPVGPGPFVVTG